ncbi:MAG: M56 family metallopeptidase [Lachnospiraceae bacterium]|nr:M56 family metallopeptidase [Lachnospiraceae bacterium]
MEQSGAYSPAHIDSNNNADIKPNAEDSVAYTDSNDNADIESNTEASSTKQDTAADSVDNPATEVDITHSRIGNDNFPQSVDDISENKPAHRIPENTVQALCILWLVAALLLFVRKITVYQSFVKYVIAGSKPVDDITLLERFGQIMAENHIKGTVELCVNDLVSSPLLIGFTHARVVLSTIDLSEDDFYYTVLHELIHYKRRDMFYKWLVQLTICLHWFNPFAYLMGHEINRTCELSCDERVIATLSDKSRKSYGDTLLNAIGTGGSYQDTLASVTLNESKELLKGRLEAIMKYKKIPKAVQTAAVFITGILVGGAAVLGAYAAPTTKSSTDRITLTDTTISADGETTGITIDSSGSQTAADTGNVAALDYSIEYEDGIFYILTGGATEADKPLSNVTNGYSKLVLVRKDEYHTFGSWRDREMQQLVRHITPLCRTALENSRMTQEDMDIVIAASTEIQEAYRSGDDIQETYRSGDNDSVTDDSSTGDSVTLYNYIQSAYYQAPYIIEIGYNLTADAQSKYSGTLITLSDQSTMPVFFSAKSEKYISDATAMSAVTALIERMAPNAAKSTSRPLEYPFIVSMEYVGETNMNSLAEKYYDEEMLTYFGAIFLELDEKTQQEYLDQMFEEENISFFACCIGMFERTDMSDTQRQKDVVGHYILKAYEEDKVNFFAVLSGELDEESRKSWLERCKKDGRADYYYILSDEDEDIFDDTDFIDDTDYFNEWDEFQNADSSYEYLSDYLENKGLLDEYNQNDIITIKDAYYYHNARVRLLVDVRSDGSFENFNYNERGTVDLRLVRDKNNDIVRVEYLSTEEAAEIIQDINDDSIPDDDDYFRSSSAPNILDLNRITKQDVSTALRDVLDSCDSGKWYVITENDCQYIYYNGLPHTYAYEPHIDGSETGDLITVAITDINMDSPLLRRRESVSDYVLLLLLYAPSAAGKNHNLAITYNGAPVTYDTISVASGTARSIADLYPDTP